MSCGYSIDLREHAIALVEGGMSRRAAARQLIISPSSSIKWFQRFAATGSFAEKPGKKAPAAPLDAHADWLLVLIAGAGSSVCRRSLKLRSNRSGSSGGGISMRSGRTARFLDCCSRLRRASSAIPLGVRQRGEFTHCTPHHGIASLSSGSTDGREDAVQRAHMGCVCFLASSLRHAMRERKDGDIRVA
ncbi:MAG TPA: hypothetical protein VIF88_16630 [Methylocystis sp.]|jgi:hypothetical protein